MAQVSMVLAMVAPIPVGHRVRVTWYVVESRGLFGASRQELPHEPVVEDLDTGIVYHSERPFTHDGMKRSGEPIGVTLQLRGTTDRVVEGVVRGCRVVTVNSFSEQSLQTHLAVEE